MTEKVWFDYDGKKCLNESAAIARLLDAGVLFCNSRQYICPIAKAQQDATIVLFVSCNDVFAWGCADAESITCGDEPGSQLYSLYELWEKSPQWGPIKWACLKRKEQPQDPIRDDMKKAGYWDADLEALPANHYWSALRKRRASTVTGKRDA